MFRIHNGRLEQDGRPFFSVGFNYHPSPSGCQYWQLWDAEQIDADLGQMAARGFNTVRFFLFWADFEPVAGAYDPVMIERLTTFVAIAGRHKLACLPSLLTIWMNGQLFDLPWRNGRDLYADAEMIAREQAYVQQIAGALRSADHILAYDLGDEVIHVDFARAQALTPDAVVAWQHGLVDAIRSVAPDVLVLQANEASTITGTHAFRPEHSQSLDLMALHGYPVWTPFSIEAIASYKASCYVPFLVQMARMDGPVLLDELGSYGGDEAVAQGYLDATAHSALVNGATGTLVWCWQDIMTTARPYDVHPGERFVGLLDGAGRAKPALATFEAFARSATVEWADLSVPVAPIGVYVPRHSCPNQPNYLAAQRWSPTAAFYAYLLLKRAHLPFEFTRAALDRYQLIICPSVHDLTIPEQDMLLAYVAGGGTLYYSVADYLHGFGGEALFGVRLADFTLRAASMASFQWRGQTYPIAWTRPDQRPLQIPVVTATAAEVLATYPNGTPALTRHRLGQGTAYYLNAPLEAQLDQPDRLEHAPWQQIYEQIARAAGIRRPLYADAPEVEVAVLQRSQERYGFAINHAPRPVQTTLFRETAAGQVEVAQVRLAGKETYSLIWQAEHDSVPLAGFEQTQQGSSS